MKAGDKFKKVYPFLAYCNDNLWWRCEHTTDEGWAGGCKEHYEDGPAVYEGQCLQDRFFTCDAEGFIEYEVLAIVDMPRKYQNRIIYRITMIDPDGNERKSSKAHTVTLAKFNNWIESLHSSYPHDYEVDD